MSLVQEILNEQKSFFNTNKTKDVEFRIENLKKLKSIIEENEDRIIEALYLDLNKSKAEGYMSEIAIVYSEINEALKNIRKWSKAKRVKGSISSFPSVSYVYNEPFGTALIMAPWNYPFNLTIAPLVASISAGNCNMLKCSRSSVHTANLIQKLINNNFDRNYLYCIDINADYDDVLYQNYDYIFFTGSKNVGKKVMMAASEHLIPFSLELGGKSPCFIDESANLKIAARRIAWGKFLNAGQTCISIDYIVIKESVKEEFIKLLLEEINLKFKDAVNNEAYPKIISRNRFDRLMNLINNEPDKIGGKSNEESNKIEPTIFKDVSFDDEIMKDEIFGPILPIISYNNLDEIIREIKDRDKPLACYVFTTNKEIEEKIINEVSYGGGCINDVIMHFTNHNLPFGGVGASGIGNYHGKFGFDTFSHKKGVLKSCKFIDLPFRYPPYDEKKFKFLKKLS